MRSWHRSIIASICEFAGFCVISGCGNQDSRAPSLSADQSDSSVPHGTGGNGGNGGTDASRETDADAARNGGSDAGGASGSNGGNAPSTDASAADAPAADAVSADSPYLSACAEGGLPTAERCNDGIDNDCDGFTDCADSDCKPVGAQGYGSSCDRGLQSGMKCDWLGACVCSTGFSSENSCSDGVDNDCDGAIDCQDSDCQPGGVSGTFACDKLGHTCGDRTDAGQAVCASCPGGLKQETGRCIGGKDDDCDGKTDCDDDDCLGQQCGLSSSQICIGTTCVDLDNDYTIKLTPERLAIPADGLARDPITITLSNKSTSPISNQLIDLKISGGGSWYGYPPADGGRPATTIQIRTDSSGKANATFLSDAAGGTAAISAVLVGANTGATVSVDMPVVDTIDLFKMENSLMGVYGSGFNEENHLTYLLHAPNGVTYPKGLTVTFTHETLRGSALGPPRSDPVIPPGGGTPVSTITGTTDEDGKVTITVYSGTEAGTASVKAYATAAGQTREYLVSNIAIVGAKASGARGRMVLSCSSPNLSALAHLNCPNSISSASTLCTVVAADRFGNALGVSKSVVFTSEAGRMGTTVSTPLYPTQKPEDLGRAATILEAVGKLPYQTESPADDEPTTSGYSLCDLKSAPDAAVPIHSPRDGIVTVIASMQGEEGFTDNNRNGQWDPGEPFIDLSEPFVDRNDNNQWDPGEDYIDVGGTVGAWDGPNGKWDANTTIWTQTRVVFTSAASPELSNYDLNPADIVNGRLQIKQGQAKAVRFHFTDVHLNDLPSDTLFSAAIHGALENSALTVEADNPIDPGFNAGIKYCVANSDADPSCDDDCYAGPICTVRSYISGYTPYTTGTVWLPAIGTLGQCELRTTATVAEVKLILVAPCEVVP